MSSVFTLQLQLAVVVIIQENFYIFLASEAEKLINTEKNQAINLRL